MSAILEREVDEQVHELLQDKKGEFLTAEIVAAATDYSESYVRERLHGLADNRGTDVTRDRRSKDIYGVIVGSGFVVITSDREQLLGIVRRNRPSEMGKAKSMTTDELQTFITEEIAVKEVATSTDKLYFGIPE
ncbi:hypothetical protein [Halobacterium salinarum]|uniref:Uncharacterized protein n=4 Tax=Halobacterium salinarum TaxID=2242 RepID=O52007_HALSA|nr:hypothetical protein [Halobacterium salinarum]AAC82887.1 unknown [Halobacterium salinarum NRC-1]MBB6090907.1 hypothetical protein [Halobacterium salinarum]MDL0125572.1 hypothetical protein [Halobacterium salinarum]QCC46144.1 uncharacterized protein HBSAL_13150 [Halobacterium salinarum]TYO71845.1 hypothetical protein APQ99_02393 [Halobacterium salinarum DSM 3754]